MSVTGEIPPVWTTATTEAIKTGTWRSALPVHSTRPSPCQGACPVNGNIADWIGHVRKQEYYAAWRILTERNPFPAVIGRVCHHPCEAACNRDGYDEALAIRRLERSVGDMALAENWQFPAVAVRYRQRVAVVGAGPSGLSAAFHLRRMGYAVTVFEARAEPGGVMRYGIPPYRLPRTVLMQEIARLLALGIDLNTGYPVNSPDAFDRLRRQYDAVYLAVGAARSKRLPQLDYSRESVIDAAHYLAMSDAEPAAKHANLLVIGGGSAAMDVARIARRRGTAVRVLCLEPEHLMPAQREEILEAREEGVAIIDASMVQTAEASARGTLLVRCVKVGFKAGARRGEFSVTPTPGSEFSLAADIIVTALGQDPDLDAFASVLNLEGRLIKVDRGQRTSLAGVFAGGDAASMDRFVSHALNMGKDAAVSVHEYLNTDRPEQPDFQAPITIGAINTQYHPHAASAGDPKLSPRQRIYGYAEVHLPLGTAAVLAESERCFSCGHCTFCDNCFFYCPDMAMVRSADGYSVLTDYCKGCGLCVKECPTGAVAMREDVQ
jgi:NADPH-dependent glutamate synthase beta subunit-like oxidoreductase